MAYIYPPNWLVRFFDEAGQVGSLVSLTRVWELTSLQPGMLAQAESLTWVASDGLEIQGWLYRAHPNPERALIRIHGGPTHHAEDRLKAEIQYLVQRGFNVLDVNYRGSTGFGLPYREAIKEDGWGGREQDDIAAGAQALMQAGLARPGLVGVTGTSYGGYSSWCQITRYPPEVIAAAAPICGMTDLRVDYETTRPDMRPYSEEMIGGSPAEIPEKYAELLDQLRSKYRVLLIVQAQDQRYA
jgi:dipeptidyl aminopeptidase/acylaminoacyl peptidase